MSGLRRMSWGGCSGDEMSGGENFIFRCQGTKVVRGPKISGLRRMSWGEMLRGQNVRGRNSWL